MSERKVNYDYNRNCGHCHGPLGAGGWNDIGELHCPSCGSLVDSVTPQDLTQTVRKVLGEVEAELLTATSKFGGFNSAHEGYAVLLEEVDELWDEIKRNQKMRSMAKMRAEAIQVSAMGARFVLDICDKGRNV